MRPCVMFVMSFPLKITVPALGLSSRTRHFPTVDFPHPDSPTSPSVSPFPIAKVTPSTAFTSPVFWKNTPPRTGKYIFKSST